MKLTIERGALLKSLAHVQSVVERRNTIPILSNVLLEAADGALALTATDIVRKLPEGAQVQLDGTGDGAQVTLKAGRSRFVLATLPKEDFPAMGAGDLPHQFGIAVQELRNLIDRTRFAISTEETRYYLNGIYLHATTSGEVKVLRAVATDGHRLARFEMPLPAGAAEMPGIIVPRKAVGELRKLLDEADGRVEVALSDAKIRFVVGGVTLTSKLIDGTFPDYQRVIPTGNDKVMEVPKRE